MLDQFEKFLKDKEARELFVTGVAGTGKTTSMKDLIEYCHEHDLNAVAAAFTHRACAVLTSKLPDYCPVVTLHKYLKKRPSINTDALKLKHVDGNSQVGLPDQIDILFVDEFSMVGERDYMDIVALQYDEEGNIKTKTVFVGDPNQLPPVKDQQTIIPKGPHWIKLTKIHRQANDNPLIDTLLLVNNFINGEVPQALPEHGHFKRGQDIVQGYLDCKKSKVLLAYTNERVQDLNSMVQGYTEPIIGDEVFSPTIRRQYMLSAASSTSDMIITIKGDILETGSKYKTLETLHDIHEVQFFILIDEEGNEEPRAVIFGHSKYLKVSQNLAKRAVDTNKKIKAQFHMEPKVWAKENWRHDLARERAAIWKKYLAFKDCVICVDFKHAMTVHKSQGSTYHSVFLDTNDLGQCADKDYNLYLKLLYVGVSRASDIVYTN